MTVDVDTGDERMDAFIAQMRVAMGEAVAAFMAYANTSYREAWQENDHLRKRVTYLEARVAELEGRRAA